MAAKKVKIFAPYPGFQTQLVRSDVDFVVAGGAMGSGKSAGALLMAAEHVSDPNFRMVFIRKNIQDTKVGGGGVDEATKFYGAIGSIKVSDNPRLSFPSGAFIDFTHMADQTPDKVLERIKGWQYSCIYIDEGTGFEWSTVNLLMSRNRSSAKWTGKIRVTCNPKRRHWLRTWVDWYIDDDGWPIPERCGMVRYFFVNGEDITDVVFGDSKEDVYAKCKAKIDELVKSMSTAEHRLSYRDFIRSTTFYPGKLTDNKGLIESDPGYIGSVAAMGERQRRQNLEGNWNVDDEDDMAPIKRSLALGIADNSPQKNGDKWLTVDLADTGTDNCVIIAWDGLHITGFQTIQQSTPAKNCRLIEHMAAKFGIGEAHIIYDAVRAAYMLDYFPNARPYVSYKPSMGVYKRIGERLKDILYLRLVECVNNSRISIEPGLAQAPYVHSGRQDTTFVEEFAKECATVNFNTTVTGKYRLWTKREMKQALGSGLSPDLLDCAVQRFLPMCDYEYGEELATTPSRRSFSQDSDGSAVNIFDDSTWF